jgi:hypothetical protein
MSARLDVNPDVVCSPLDDGGVLLDLRTKQYFALNATGLFVWQLLEDGGSLEALGAALVASGVADGFTGLAGFEGMLLEHGLVLASAGSGAAGDAPSVPALPPSWTAPRLTPHGRPLAEVILSPFDPTVPVPE